MRIPILTRRGEKRQAQIDTAVEVALEKAGAAPALAGAPKAEAISGATYPVPNPSSPVPNPSSPFMQTGGNYGANPLPRPSSSFGSLFGPGYPLFPDALDPLRPDGRADPRRYEYPVTWNIQLVDRDVPWSYLRQIATQVDVVTRCIELVQDAIGGMSWSWGFSPQIINQIRNETGEPNSAKAIVLAQDKYGDELHAAQKFFERPDERMDYTFIQWLTAMVWSHLVYDGIVVYPSYTLKGDIHSLSLLDTSTIKVLLDNQGFLPQPPAPAYQQILYGFPRGEFQAEVAGDGTIPNGYRRDQLAYYIRRPRLHTPYGFSHVEESINYATLYQQRQEWMHSEWSHGVTPKLVIETSDTESWTPEQMMYYQNAWNDEWSGQTQRRQQAAFLRPGMKPIQLHEMAELYKSDYDQWLVMQIAAKFGVPQTQMGIPMALHNMSGGVQNLAQMDLTDKFSLDALVNFLIDCINDMARRFLGIGHEITIVASGSNTDQANLVVSQADASDVNNGIKTRNEVRAERGIPLITDPEADMLGITTATGVTFLPGSWDLQEAQREIVEQGVDTEPDRQRASGKDERSDPNVKPTAVRPVRQKDTPHTQRNDKGGRHVSPKAHGGVALSSKVDTGSYHVKELEAFARFAKGRIERGDAWRDFEFEHVDDATAQSLNAVARSGDLDGVYSYVKSQKEMPKAAGLLVVARDTGRVLLVQRSVDDKSGAAGRWEIPGGHLDNRENSLDAALREWREETGNELPKGKVVGKWSTPNDNYHGFIYRIKHEDDVDLDAVPRNGKEIENAGWWRPEDLLSNPAVRVEFQSIDWSLLGNAVKAAAKVTKADSNYRATDSDTVHCTNCVFVQLHGDDPSTCQRVLGNVHGEHVCDLFKSRSKA